MWLRATSTSQAVRQEWVMQPPPPETVYLPFESGPYRMAMALTTVPESAWFEIDARYGDEMAERRRLLAERQSGVFGALPSPTPRAPRHCVRSWPI